MNLGQLALLLRGQFLVDVQSVQPRSRGSCRSSGARGLGAKLTRRKSSTTDRRCPT